MVTARSQFDAVDAGASFINRNLTSVATCFNPARIAICRSERCQTAAQESVGAVSNGNLQDAAVGTIRRHAARLIKEPESLPLFHEHTEVLGRNQQLAGTPFRHTGIDRQEAADIAAHKES